MPYPVLNLLLEPRPEKDGHRLVIWSLAPMQLTESIVETLRYFCLASVVSCSYRFDIVKLVLISENLL